MSRSALAACAFLWASVALAQRGIGDWTTSGGDAQRSSWVRIDPKISVESLQKPGFELVWKLKLNNASRQLNSLTPPALIDFYISYRGFRTLGFFGGSSDTVVGVDTDLARIEWEKNFGPSPPAAGSSIPCPGGMTSAVTRPAMTTYAPNLGGRGFGRGTPAKSGVGEPFQGAVTIRPAPAATPAAPQAAPVNRRVSAPPNVFAARVQYVHALTGDGKLHSLYISNGEEPKPPVQFLAPNANARGLIVFDNTAYVATSNSCGGVENGVWALNLESQKVTHWKSPGRGVAGSAGPAVGPDGTLYAAGGGELVALEPKTLKVKSSYSAGQQEFTSSPLIFDYKGKDLIAVTSNDGRLHLLDSAALGATPLGKTPAFSTAGFEAGALASWQDSSGVRWILSPAAGAVSFANGEIKNGAIVAWKLVEENGAPVLQPGWVSRDLLSPLPPIVINGVIFALSSGEFRTNDARMTAAQRAARSSPAILYALDAATGRELWNSGTAISSFVHSGGLSGGGTRVYVGTHDGTQYAFGFPIEH